VCWRIVKTMGSKITASHVDARLLRGTGGAGTLFASTWLGILVSTTAHFSGRSLGWSGTKDFFSALDRKQYCGGLDHCDPATATIAATCYGLTWLMAATRCREESASPLNANARRRERNIFCEAKYRAPERQNVPYRIAIRSPLGWIGRAVRNGDIWQRS
jgi:hypothetical protein